MIEEKEFKIRGIATDVTTYEWEEDDIINKSPVVLEKFLKEKVVSLSL